MRFQGTLTTWNDERGFGFITPSQGGDEVFVHIKAFSPSVGRPRVGLLLDFEVELGPQGKKRASRVTVVRQTRAASRAVPESPAQWGTASLFVLPAFLLIYIVTSMLWRTSFWWTAAYVGLSLLTFLVYALDKTAAIKNRWRTSENTLHALALFGGWPGALLAQQILRHKSTKVEFRRVFWATVVLNVVAFVVVASPLGDSLLG